MADLIDRQAAINAVTEELDMIDHVPQWVFDRLEGRLRQLPPAQPETATVGVGKSKGGVTMWYECDACGEPVDQGDVFCSGCGRELIHE